MFVVLAFVGAGCSSDESSDATSDPATDTTAESPDPTEAPDGTETPGSTEPASSTTEAAPTTTEPEEPVRILVTNDDGIDAPGIDAVVKALLAYEARPLDITVVAPAEQQSGTGGNVTDGELVVAETTTASGYPAVSVAGFPADSIIWAFDQNGIDFEPDLVISGANSGQNIGPVVDLSGTVGAARAAANRNIPAIAISAGFYDPIDFDAAAFALLAYLDENLDDILAHQDGTKGTVVSINTPSCAVGEIRGTVEVPLAAELGDIDYGGPVDCNSTFENPTNDVEAFYNGFVAVSPTPLEPAES